MVSMMVLTWSRSLFWEIMQSLMFWILPLFSTSKCSKASTCSLVKNAMREFYKFEKLNSIDESKLNFTILLGKALSIRTRLTVSKKAESDPIKNFLRISPTSLYSSTGYSGGLMSSSSSSSSSLPSSPSKRIRASLISVAF